jgi:hypothetical protein
MPITEEQYNRVKQALLAAADDPDSMSPEVRARAEAAATEYEAGLAKQLDPDLPPMAQALSIQPATTHPEGDAAAEQEWMRNPGGANGTVFVYEMPLERVKKDLLEHPDQLGAMGYSRIPPTPEDIQGMDENSSIYHSYNDMKWRETADAAAKSGKRAYRYSKAPWLQGGGVMNTLSSLGMKLHAGFVPGLEQFSTFVMGMDDMASFGAARAAQETADSAGSEYRPPKPDDGKEYYWHPTLGWTPAELKYEGPEMVGGVIPTAQAEGLSQKETNRMLEGEYPNSYLAGQVMGVVPGALEGAVKAVGKTVGAAGLKTVEKVAEAAGKGLERLAPWSASNALYEEVASGGNKLLARAGLNASALPVTAGAAAGFAGGALTQGAQEAVDAAANYVQTGDTGTTAGDAVMRSLGAGLAPAVVGGAGSALGTAAGKVGEWVRSGPKGAITGGRYKGIPGKLERAGLEPKFGEGYTAPPAVKAAQQEARTLDVPVEQVLAEKVAPKVSAGAKALRRDALPRQRVGADGEVSTTSKGNADQAKVARRAAPKGDAYEPVKRYAAGRNPDVRQTRAIRAAAEKAGPDVARELEQTRVPALLGELETLTAPARKTHAQTLLGTGLQLADRGMINYAYPAIRALEGQVGPLANGRLGRFALAGKDEKAPEGKDESGARYAAWRAEQLRRKKAPKPRRRRHAGEPRDEEGETP